MSIITFWKWYYHFMHTVSSFKMQMGRHWNHTIFTWKWIQVQNQNNTIEIFVKESYSIRGRNSIKLRKSSVRLHYWSAIKLNQYSSIVLMQFRNWSLFRKEWNSSRQTLKGNRQSDTWSKTLNLLPISLQSAPYFYFTKV